MGKPISFNGSGDFASLASASGCVEVPLGIEECEGEALRFFPF